MGEAIRQFDVRNEDLLSYDAQGIAPLYSCPGATVAFGRIQPGCSGMQGISSEGCEDNAVVLGGKVVGYLAVVRDVWVAEYNRYEGQQNTGYRAAGGRGRSSGR